MSISEMLDELVQNGRGEHAAAVMLGRALEDGAIALIFNDERLRPTHVAGVVEYIQLAAARNAREIRLRLGWVADIMLHARGLRSQFEQVCELTPSQSAEQPHEPPKTREEAVKACLDGGMLPANTVSWSVFCDHVRDLANGWIDKKQGTVKRGFDSKTIQRDVKKLLN